MKFSPLVLALWFPLLLTACGSEEPINSSLDPSLTEIPAFNLLDIILSPEQNSFRFSWDGDSTGLTYTVCVEDLTRARS